MDDGAAIDSEPRHVSPDETAGSHPMRTLRPLSKRELSALIRRLTGMKPASRIVAQLADRAAADPWFVAAVVRALLSGGDRAVTGLAELIVSPPEPPGAVLRREGEFWTIVYDAETVRLRDSKGLRYLAQLLAHPWERLSALELAPAAAKDGTGPKARECARLAVTKAIRNVLARIRACHPALGGHLTATVKCGRTCGYFPDPRRPLAWETETGAAEH